VEVGLELVPVVAADRPQLSVDVSLEEELLVVGGSDGLDLEVGHLLGVVLHIVADMVVILDLDVEGVVDLLLLVGVPLVAEIEPESEGAESWGAELDGVLSGVDLSAGLVSGLVLQF